MIQGSAGHTDAGRRAAFFDVDNTLIQGDTQEMEGRYLARHERLSPGQAFVFLRILAAMGMCRMGWMSLARQNRAYLKVYRGRTRDELDALGRQLFNRQVRTRVLGQALEILEAHRAKGDLIVLVSATTRHLLQPLGQVFRPDHVFCTGLEFDQKGRATGQALDGICVQEKKAALVRAFAGEQGLDLAVCHAYSDHHSDLPLLQCVGHPEVINPTAELFDHACKAGWPVHQFSLTA